MAGAGVAPRGIVRVETDQDRARALGSVFRDGFVLGAEKDEFRGAILENSLSGGSRGKSQA